MSSWWNEAVFYQVCLRSFQDSNGDGIGDLRGLVNRLDYLQELGINAIWVTPFYESPHVDFGYDVSGHKNIDSRYGNMSVFEDLISEANKRNLKIVVDIILNHTSDQHPFFIESRRSCTSAKRDWYIWCDGKPDGSPPNNWEGFERSTWTFDPKTNQYYYHFHYHEQPDLNWRNSAVVEEMFSICDFWLNKGVAGLRLDAINYLLEDPQLLDNPILDRVPDYLRNIYQFNQDPIHTINHPDNHKILKKLRHHLKTNHQDDPLLIGEVWVPNFNEIRRFYGEKDDEIQLPFNFFLSTLPQVNAHDFREMIMEFQQILEDLPTTLVLSNHDFERATSRYATEENSDAMAKLLATLLLTLRGIPFIYYGEELGLRDYPPETIEEVQDPRGRIRWPDYKGRDGCRTPMPWNSQPQAGFTTGQPWYKLNPDYQMRNVAVQTDDPNSVLNHYKKLLKLRRDLLPLSLGQLTMLGNDIMVLAYMRSYKDQNALIALNMSDNHTQFSLAQLPHQRNSSWKILLSTHIQSKDKIVQETLTLNPFEAIIVVPI
ncbi:alpha-amylase family glycosyl hydrolase [cyanobacterium endosymbiont of Epithemia turgida]|uniref:alpha-amylase family glycosyl hydrolase n=1 Tax=cyanobacterium endosymbiont of Epithemia turgida TaxID=718217 RepID=UPI0004D1E7FB|nr:alpha-amylase family glycosyl hydrolase [cyanobacterium endosymbiont of Epithemia turgida]BAP16934.1 alpha-glucosidase [cyanobacterium endosymbiont of Epithemia turgida isolate EtSB Lake Yunoko]